MGVAHNASLDRVLIFSSQWSALWQSIYVHASCWAFRAGPALSPARTRPGASIPMCTSQHIYHRCCRCWGKERLEPCIRSCIIDGYHTGCGYIESLGTVDTEDLCLRCRSQATHDLAFERFKRALPRMSVRNTHLIVSDSCSVPSNNNARLLLVLGRRRRDHVIVTAGSGFLR